jgi:hypothetical protein
MSQATKLKYIVNYNHTTFNSKTRKYETNEDTYDNLKEAKAIDGDAKGVNIKLEHIAS